MAYFSSASTAAAPLAHRANGPMILRLLRSSDVQWAASGWVFFIVENTVLSENRTFLIERFGRDGYYAAYGTCSTAATVSILYSYWKLTRAPAINGSIGTSSISMADTASRIVGAVAAGSFQQARVIRLGGVLAGWTCMSLGLIMASQILPKIQIPFLFSAAPSVNHDHTMSDTKDDGSSRKNDDSSANPSASRFRFQLRCPFDFSAQHRNSHDNTSSTTVQGMDRISRHVGLWSLAAVFASNAFLVAPTRPIHQLWAMRTWYMGPTAVAWLGGMHADSRYRRGIGGQYDPWYTAQTSNVPFMAILTGKQGSPIQVMQSLIQSELKPINALLALTASTLFVLRRVR